MKRWTSQILSSLPAASVLGASMVLCTLIIVGAPDQPVPTPRANAAQPATGSTRPPTTGEREWKPDPALTNSADKHQPPANQRGSRPRRGGKITLTPERIERFLELATTIDAERGAKLRSQREDNPEQFARALAQNGRTILGLMALEERNPQLFALKVRELQLDVAMRTLAGEIRGVRSTGGDGERRALKVRLWDLVREHVDHSLQVRAIELLMFEEKIRTVKQDLQRDAENAEGLARALFDELIGAEARRSRPAADVNTSTGAKRP